VTDGIGIERTHGGVDITGLNGMLAPEEWTRSALCAQVDPDLFTPDKNDSTQPAKAICARCTVADECLTWAFENAMHKTDGIYGGLTSSERRRLKRGRK
jgi:WhiB family redox-sensing transcriptional regulator